MDNEYLKPYLKRFPAVMERRALKEVLVFECTHAKVPCPAIVFEDNESFAQSMVHEYLRGYYASAEKHGEDWYYYNNSLKPQSGIPIASLKRTVLYGMG